MIRPIRLVRSFLTVGVWTLLSRILGLVRDVMIANFLGSGAAAQAFLIAFSLPNMFRRFFAEGAFNAAFVPMFSKKVESGQGAQRFAQDAFSGLASVLLAFTLLAQIAMPFFVYAMASGFAGDARFDLAVLLGRIAFPYILFISLAALLSGVLNATGRFAAAAAAPILLNIILIASIAFAHFMGFDVALTMTWAVPIAGIAQMALLWVAASKAGMRLTLRRPRLTPELKKLAKIAAPAALAGGVVQINLLVGRQVASYFDGAVAWLSYADRLYQLPLGLVGVAIGIVLLPSLSRSLQSGDEASGQDAFNRANEFALGLSLPAAFALVVIPLPLVSVLFERGAFAASDSSATAAAVAIYGLGLPAFVLQKTYLPLFFAREDTKSPFRFAVYSMIANTVIAIGLAPVIGYLSAALAASLSAWLMLWFLWRGARGMGAAAMIDTRFRRKIVPMIGASALMAVVAVMLVWLLGSYLTASYIRYVALALVVMVSAGAYVAAALGLKVFSLAELRQGLRG
jgi:putative peptidoglycan lipid II flippase